MIVTKIDNSGYSDIESSGNSSNKKVIKLTGHKRAHEDEVVEVSIISLFERCIDAYDILNRNYLEHKSFMDLRITCKYLYECSMMGSPSLFRKKVVIVCMARFLERFSLNELRFFSTNMITCIKINHLKDCEFSLRLYNFIGEVRDVKLVISISDNEELIQFIQLVLSKKSSMRKNILGRILRSVVELDLSSIDIDTRNVKVVKRVLKLFSKRMEKLALGNIRTGLTLAGLSCVKAISCLNIGAEVIMEGLESLETVLLRNIHSMLTLSKLPKLEMVRLWYIYATLTLEELPYLNKLSLEEMKLELIKLINVPKLTCADVRGKAINLSLG